jgi:phosphomannomutase
MAIVSVSGIRGIYNEDLTGPDVVRYVRGFVKLGNAGEFLLARDTRSTGDLLKRVVAGAIMGEGANVVDYDIISTPALFRESRKSGKPAVMITASHNPPQWNGLKFIRNGTGIGKKDFESIVSGGPKTPAPRKILVSGRIRRSITTYEADVLQTQRPSSGSGVNLVLDLGGGAAIKHAPAILRTMGCNVHTLADAPGIFERTIDPTADPLDTLSSIVIERSAQIGFAFDCDGDRLVIVDGEGRKRSGDFMLTMALIVALSENPGSNVAVSVDTTQAVDEVVKKAGGKVYRTPVGEANVLEGMIANRARFGGEGSSGGFIDGEFNNCRDSMVAATALIRGLKRWGKRFYSMPRVYHQTRIRLEIPRSKGAGIAKKMVKENPEAETLDGIKIRISPSSWVLVRSSGTEDIVRVSAEAGSKKEADEIADSYGKKVKRLSA